MLQGRIPDAEVITIIPIINEMEAEEIPKKGSGYIVDKIVCNNEVEAEWDTNTWNLTNIKNPNNLIKKTCTVNFKKIEDKTYSLEATCNNGATGNARIVDKAQAYDVSNYNTLKVNTTWHHWVIYNADSTYSSSIRELGYSASYTSWYGGSKGTIANSEKTYDISNINSIYVWARSGMYGNTTVNITLTNQ